METTAPQPFIFLITIYGGLIAGLIYDIYRAIRKALQAGRFVTAVLDTLFILTLGMIVTAVLYAANFGELRLYTFVGLVLGFALYMSGLSPLIAYIVHKIRKRFKIRKTQK